ncbi:MAG: BGTF surface domain-containing protein [Haloarculaceae archaeon]
MSARETAAFLAAATLTLLVAGAGVAAATSAPSAAQAGNTTVEHDGESVTLPASSNATLVGETTLEPGTELRVLLRSSGENAFLLTNDTTVRADGRFVATFDASAVPDGTDATVIVRGDGRELAETSARLVAEETNTPSPTGSATPSATGTSSGAGPGFGPLVAVGATLGTALVLARRR